MRNDMLVYTTSAFQQDFYLAGPVSVVLYASSSAVDTDFTAKLVDVWPSGFAQNLTEGILRARYRDPEETARLLKPGKIYRLKIDLWSTGFGWRFPAQIFHASTAT
jgi:predicted acyl esterase